MLLGGWVGGCNQSGGGKKLHLAFVTNNASDFWTIARAGCKKAEEEVPNITVDFQIPADGTAAELKRRIPGGHILLRFASPDALNLAANLPEEEVRRRLALFAAASVDRQGETQGALSSVQGLTAIASPLVAAWGFSTFTGPAAPVLLPPLVLNPALTLGLPATSERKFRPLSGRSTMRWPSRRAGSEAS